MAIVVDASIAIAWSFPDERDTESLAAARKIIQEGGLVPALWLWEVQNVLRNAERRGRIDEEKTARILRDLRAMPMAVAPSPSEIVFGPEFDLARRFGLTVFDAAYLGLALRRGIPLATRDTELRTAANTIGLLWSPA